MHRQAPCEDGRKLWLWKSLSTRSCDWTKTVQLSRLELKVFGDTLITEFRPYTLWLVYLWIPLKSTLEGAFSVGYLALFVYSLNWVGAAVFRLRSLDLLWLSFVCFASLFFIFFSVYVFLLHKMTFFCLFPQKPRALSSCFPWRRNMKCLSWDGIVKMFYTRRTNNWGKIIDWDKYRVSRSLTEKRS